MNLNETFEIVRFKIKIMDLKRKEICNNTLL